MLLGSQKISSGRMGKVNLVEMSAVNEKFSDTS